MRLLPHVLLAYLALGLQLGLDGLLTLRTAGGGYGKFDLVYTAAAGISAMLPKQTAPTAALVIGLLHDLATSGPIGPRAVGYGLAGLLISRASPRVFVGFVGVAAAGAVVASFAAWLVLSIAGGTQTLGGASLTGFMTAITTLALAWPLWKLRGRLVLSERRM